MAELCVFEGMPVYLPVESEHLVAEHPTETEKRWRLREEQDRPIISAVVRSYE